MTFIKSKIRALQELAPKYAAAATALSSMGVSVVLAEVSVSLFVSALFPSLIYKAQTKCTGVKIEYGRTEVARNQRELAKEQRCASMQMRTSTKGHDSMHDHMRMRARTVETPKRVHICTHARARTHRHTERGGEGVGGGWALASVKQTHWGLTRSSLLRYSALWGHAF